MTAFVAQRQHREHVQLLVQVVLRGGLVEIAHHVARGLAGLLVRAVRAHVLAQARQQAQHALDALVAGLQHLERFLEARAAARPAGDPCHS